MAWTIEIDDAAFKQLRKMGRQEAKRIRNYLRTRIEPLDDPRQLGSALKGARFGELWRYRVGDYRIICDIQDHKLVVLVLEIGHRREIYRWPRSDLHSANEFTMKTVSTAKSHGGVQGVYSHASEICNCEMTFAVFVPPQAKDGPCPVLWYLSGLTCTHANVMEKGEYRRKAAELGLIIVCPDTSPRGEDVPDEPDNWQFGSGASFYLDATEAPYSENYRIYSYLMQELPAVIEREFPADMTRQSIFGHSMGGHGALTIALKHPDRFKSCSAFAPIVEPSTAGWSKTAFERYLGNDPAGWRSYNACALVEDGHRFDEFLIDQGTADGFLDEGLRPWLFEEACKKAGIPLTLNMREGYDHSYFFISSFMEEHLAWHGERIKR